MIHGGFIGTVYLELEITLVVMQVIDFNQLSGFF